MIYGQSVVVTAFSRCLFLQPTLHALSLPLLHLACPCQCHQWPPCGQILWSLLRLHFTSPVCSLQQKWHSHFLEPFSEHHSCSFPPFSVCPLFPTPPPLGLKMAISTFSLYHLFFLRDFMIAVAFNTNSIFSSYSLLGI